MDRRAIIKEAIAKAQQIDDQINDLQRTFVRQYFDQMPLDDLLSIELDDLYGLAMAHWKLGTVHTPDKPRVHIYNPQRKTHGWDCPHTIIQVITSNRPFLVDSLSMAINRAGLTKHLSIHPILNVRRNKQGRLLALHEQATDDTVSESYMHFQVSRLTDIDALHEELISVIHDVQATSKDWQAMRTQVLRISQDIQKGVIDETQRSEQIAFINWLTESHFTFLGYCEFKQRTHGKNITLTPIKDSQLGLLRDCDKTQLAAILPYTNSAYRSQATLSDNTLVHITKTDAISTVHRPVRMDMISVLRYDKKNDIIGRICLIGLFTSAAYNLRVQDVPLLRQKVDWVIDQSSLDGASHNGKVLANVLASYPRDALFQSSAEEINAIANGIVDLQDRQRIRLFVRSDPYQRFRSCMVFIPREKYARELRFKIQHLLVEAFRGSDVEFDVTFSSGSTLARLYFVIYTDSLIDIQVDLDALEKSLVEAGRSWEEKLNDALLEHYGDRAADTLHRYIDAFPIAYKDRFESQAVCVDIQAVERVYEQGGIATYMYRDASCSTRAFNFKVFSDGKFITPSSIVPVFENMGLKVLEERPYSLRPNGAAKVWLHEFKLQSNDCELIDLETVRESFQDTFSHVWRGDIEDDGFNRLVIGARLSWRNTVMLRAYCKYLLQIRVPFSQSYMIDTLASNTAITTLLVRLFDGRFNPDASISARAQHTLAEKIHRQLDAISNLDKDRILRSFLNLIQATTRTNYYQQTASGHGKPYLSFKLDTASVLEIPLPKPMFEIFVCSPRVEGVHLRGGKVARGGLRWSDRREDFRTEVLGLMKAQMVKNSVIVPVGSKGGFVVKQPPQNASRETLMKEAVDCYQTFLRGLLDITDNLVAGESITPPRVVRYDADDAYLVVAADKGTATFSDIANEVAAEYNFWLGDAFASGGSIGYDHKKMGITARGAWESVKRHFRELGVDTQSQSFSVIAIGDMGGDVFGNGMLLSEHIKLVAAFNHLHIFLDPNPDPKTSYAERKRLFALPRSSWQDYNAQIISKGGGVYQRTEKSIPLSPKIQAVLGIDKTSLAPNDLIRLMLQAPVDLLWNGGIGTYVKASSETHADIRDRANDPVRVDGAQLRCKVVGEGGNLGLSQLGRIEFAQHGGILYTDAIDNSAGVDCSDHEVNIKILLQAALEEGKLTPTKRNQLLAAMTNEVGELVLVDNYHQTQAISIENARAAPMLEEHARFIDNLEAQNKLNRTIEYLPDPEEIAERMADKHGLTRPELAVIVSYSKMTLFEEIVDSSLLDDAFLMQFLVNYFPQPLRKKFLGNIIQHRLRREIIATVLTNQLINRLGPTFAQRLKEQISANAAEVCKAFVISSTIFDMPTLWSRIEALDNQVSATTQIDLLALVNGLCERCIHWLIRNRHIDKSIEEVVSYFHQGVAQLRKGITQTLAEAQSTTLASRTRYFCDAGVPEELSAHIAVLVPYSSAFDIVDIANQDKYSVKVVASVFFQIGSRLELTWLRDQIANLDSSSHWHQLATDSLRTDLHDCQRTLVAKVLRSTTGAKIQPKKCVDEWYYQHQDNADHFLRLLAEMKASKALDFAMLSLAVSALHQLRGPPIPN